MYAVQKIAMQYWDGPEKPNEVIETIELFDDIDEARNVAVFLNHALAGSMWSFRYIVMEVET